MIHESYYWKKELYTSFLSIAKFRHLKRPNEQSFVKIEKALMIGAYIIRKLADAKKLPPNLLKTDETLEIVNSKGTIVDYMNWHNIDKHYDLTKRTSKKKDWQFIINQIIHSYTFIYSFDDEGKLDGFLINSDATKKELLFYLPLKTVFLIFLSVSEGDITSMASRREIIGKEIKGNAKFGELKVIQADYTYPNDFNLNLIIAESMRGKVYLRKKE